MADRKPRTYPKNQGKKKKKEREIKATIRDSLAKAERNNGEREATLIGKGRGRQWVREAALVFGEGRKK